MNPDYILDPDGLDGLTMTGSSAGLTARPAVQFTADTIPRSQADRYRSSMTARVILGAGAAAIFGFFVQRAVDDGGIGLNRAADDQPAVELTGIAALNETPNIPKPVAPADPDLPENMPPPTADMDINSNAAEPEDSTAATSPDTAENPQAGAAREFQYPRLFAFASSRARPLTTDQLQRTLEFIRGCSGAVMLVGLTDNQGPEEYNRILGKARARAVKKQLAPHLPSHRFQIITEGSGNPANARRGANTQAENRRVLIRCGL